MRKNNKLYTVNKWNKPLFATNVDREYQNIFDGLTGSTLNTPTSNTDHLLAGDVLDLSDSNNYVSKDSIDRLTGKVGPQIQPTTPDFGKVNLSPKNVKVDTSNIKLPKSGGLLSGLGSLKGGVASTIGSAVGGLAYNGLSGGLNSKAGSMINSIGGTVGSLLSKVNPAVGTIVQIGSGLVGGGMNALIGTKIDQKKLQAANEGTDYMKSYQSNAKNFDEVIDPKSLANVQNAAKGGAFKKTWEKNFNNRLKRERNDSELLAYRNRDNNIDNIADTQMDTLQENYAAFGGPLGSSSGALEYGLMSDYLLTKDKAAGIKDRIPSNVFGSLQQTPMFAMGGNIHIKDSHRGLFTKEAQEHGMGVQEFASHVLANKEKYSPEVVKRANFARNATKFALGGDMQTNGGDFSDGLTMINAGGSHEENPYDGVQVGISQENGNPNLVEEGETIFDDYVFSKRIKADKQTKKKFHIGRNADITYADLSKKLEKESSERPNDPISQAGLKRQLHDLAEEQERQKAEMQQKQAQEIFDKLPPEQQQAILQQVAAQEQQAQQQQMQEGQQEAQQQQGQPSEEEMAAMQQQQAQQQGGNEQMMQQMQDQADMQPQEGEQINACGGRINRFKNGGDMKSKIYKLLNLYTDSDFDKWAEKNKVGKVTDWENILQNKAFIDALTKDNAALKDAISRGYDFGSYKTPKGNYDNEALIKKLDAYTKSKQKGYLKGNYTADNNFDLGNHKSLKELEADPNYKGFTDYLAGAAKRAKGIKYWDNGDYDSIVWDDLNKTFSREDYNALKVLRHFVNGTSVNPNGDHVPIWQPVGEDGAHIIADNAVDLINKYRNDGVGGIFHFTPDVINRDKTLKNIVVNPDGTTEEIYGDVPKDWKSTGNYSWSGKDGDFTYNYYTRPDGSSTDTGDKNSGFYTDKNGRYKWVPKHKSTFERLAGVFGPSTALSLMKAGVGAPDYKPLDAAVNTAFQAPALAHYKTINNYLQYEPMDIWREQNRMNANSRATDRAIMNNATPVGTKNASLLANSYISQLGSGDLYAKALEYNNADKKSKAEFNRGTAQYNADAFTRTSATNAGILNNAQQLRTQMQMNAAKERMDSEASWYRGMYGNLNNIFKGLSDIGKENAQYNMIADMAGDGIFGVMTGNQYTGRGIFEKQYVDENGNPIKLRKNKLINAYGGKIGKKKGKRRGLTF